MPVITTRFNEYKTDLIMLFTGENNIQNTTYKMHDTCGIAGRGMAQIGRRSRPLGTTNPLSGHSFKMVAKGAVGVCI